MSFIDVAIVVIVVLAVLIGWVRGLFRPLITWAFIIAGVVIGFGYPAIAARFRPERELATSDGTGRGRPLRRPRAASWPTSSAP